MGGLLIYGHRGASTHVRANTVEAYALAVEQGADGVELDVRRSRDRALVIHHDDRSARGAPPFVDLDFREIRATSPWVPTLDEAWDALGPRTLLNIEIKNRHGEVDYDPVHRLARAVARWIAAHDADDRILVSSFNAQTLTAFKNSAPDIKTGLLSTPWLDPFFAIEMARGGRHASVNLSLARTLPQPDQIVEAAGDLAVLVWTVNDPNQAAALSDAGIAGIFTDDPGLMVKALSGRE